MSKVKVAYLTDKGRRAEFLVRYAPPGVEVTIVDIKLPDEEKALLCRDADALILQPADVSMGLLKQCPKLKLIQVLSGHDRLDLKAVSELGVPVAIDGGTNSITVAEHTIGLMISVAKRLMLQWDTATNRRQWQEGLREELELSEVTGKTVGIVGFGHIGKEVAKHLMGFDTRTIYYDTMEIPLEVQKELRAKPVPFEELLRESDIVSLHVLLTRRTRGMISERELAMMKPTAILINTCRGAVVDEKALYRALVDGRIGAAGLDVLEKEPPPKDNPLFDLKNVVITPHMAGLSKEREVRTAKFTFANIQRVVAGEAPESQVFPE